MNTRIFINSGVFGKARSGISEVITRFSGFPTIGGSRVKTALDMMDAAYTVPWLMAAGGAVSRGTIGPGFDIVPNNVKEIGSESKRKRILAFFNYVPPVMQNIKDIYGPLAKLYTTVFSFRIFGQAAWELLKNDVGFPIGFDYIPGIVRPNIEKNGEFKVPAYRQYLRYGSQELRVEYDNPNDVILFAVPDFSSGIWLADSFALGDYSLPSEIYAARAYKSLHENRNAPYAGIWYTDEDASDEVFDSFVDMVRNRYTGSGNYGRNPIIMRGKGGFESISPSKDDAPYVEGREITRNELSAVLGVPGPKYGIGMDRTSSTALSELRREFYESTLRPVMSLIEEYIYNHICIRIFDAPEWVFRFKRPDFTTAIEDASISLRRIQWGEWSPNEARVARGESPRDGGDYYVVPSNMNIVGKEQPGRPTDPIDDNEGDMRPGAEDPVPDTQPPVKPEVSASIDDAILELNKWKRFATRIAKGQRYEREFSTEFIPEWLTNYIRDTIPKFGDQYGMVVDFFDDITDMIKIGELEV